MLKSFGSLFTCLIIRFNIIQVIFNNDSLIATLIDIDDQNLLIIEVSPEGVISLTVNDCKFLSLKVLSCLHFI